MASIQPNTLRSTLNGLLNGQIQQDEYLAATLNSIKDQQHLNAFISAHEDMNSLDRNARTGPLSGIPFSAKDNILSKAFPTTAGSPLLADFNPGRNAEIVNRLEAAGAILVGKNNLPEFCQGMTTNNATFGQAENPVVPGAIPGGSSGGSAAAVAAGLVPFAIASDTGGSVRIPAALCGCAGFRPTIGRYPIDGFIPVSPMFDAPGVIANNACDIALIDQVIVEHSGKTRDAPVLQGLRVGVPHQYFYEDLHPETESTIEFVLERFREAGAELVFVNIEGVDELNSRVGFPIAFYDMLRELSVFLAREGCPLSLHDLVQGIVGSAEKGAIQAQLREAAIPHKEYIDAIQIHLPNYVALIERYFSANKLDLIAVPTVPLPAVASGKQGEDHTLQHNGREQLAFTTYIRNTEPLSNYGGPCLTLPAGTTKDGRPVGIELAATKNHDRELLALACELEQLI